MGQFLRKKLEKNYGADAYCVSPAIFEDRTVKSESAA